MISGTGSTRVGDIDLLWTVAQDLNIPSIIDRLIYRKTSISAGKVLTAWAINRVMYLDRKKRIKYSMKWDWINRIEF